MIDWVVSNKEWIFSGIGVALIGFVYSTIQSKKKANKIVQKGGDNSINNIGDGNTNIKI